MRVENSIPVLSFFSGGGFFDMGFEQAGFSIVWTNEVNKTFASMHAAGITSWRRSRGNGVKAEIFNTNPIETITPGQIIQEAFPSGQPPVFGVIGGPPCQDFSSSGKNAGFEGEKGTLTELFFNYILAIQPNFFVFENVRNLVNNNKHKKYLDQLLEKIRVDYELDHKVLNAIDYGIPQDRHRLFLVGIKRQGGLKDGTEERPIKFPWPTKLYNNPLETFEWPLVEKFQKGTKPPMGIPPDIYINGLLFNTDSENSVANANEYFLPHSEKFYTVGEGDTRNRSFKRLHRYKYSPTACYGNNEVHLHPYLPRRLSVREALRIQTVPDTYVLPKEIGLTPKFKMIGNGVPVELAHVVARQLQQHLKNLKKYGYLVKRKAK